MGAPGTPPYRSYPSYVAGEDVESDRHIYVMTARSVLENDLAAIRRKRLLESGEPDPDQGGPGLAGRCALATPETVQKALAAAAAAAPQWARTPLDLRLRLGELIRKRLSDVRAEFVDIMVAEGRPRTVSEWEIDGLMHTLSPETLGWCAELLHREFSYNGRYLAMRRRPDGVVCVAPPQNAPHSNTIYGAFALLSGNTVLIRAPRSIPLGSMYAVREIIAPALDEVGAPPGTLNAVCGPPMMEDWLRSEHVDDIIYFGGTEKGMAFQNDCVAAGKKPILELAGNDCAVVWRDADLDMAVGALVEAFNSSGQICNVPNRVIAHPAIADELLERLATAAARIRPGYPDQEGVVLTPVLAMGDHFTVIADALRKGGRLVCGGRRLDVNGEVSDTGFYAEPTVVRVDGLDGAHEVDAVREETFFPMLPVVVPGTGRSDDRLLEDVITFVNANTYGLRNSLWAADESVVDRFVNGVVNGGMLKVNDTSHCGFFPYMPSHGGTGLTGGVFGEATYMMIRTTHLQGVSAGPGRRAGGGASGREA
ncbi:aldehyde dehydrogenase [Sphaerisporangium sp. B11E5]|uniref:aldehyde dehydrogenase family protein n=1 Tax=Sphaerisporangium sp. B11E5 TaxID=3153563 RepID=UPI00325DF94E